MQERVLRLIRLLPVPLMAVALAGCSGGGEPSTPRSAAPKTTATPIGTTETPGTGGTIGFPTTDDGPTLEAARTFVETVTTYDHTKLGNQLKAVLPLTANPLHDELRQSLSAGGDFARTVQNNARDANGRVLDLGLVFRAGNRATVLVFVDQAITSPSANATQRLRERVTMTRTNGTWLAVKLETL